MNKKGFTTIELVISFIMVIVILTSLIGFTIAYRDKISIEETKSKLVDFKNTITKVVYDDIISGKIERMEYCTGEENCVNFIDYDGASHALKLINKCENITCASEYCNVSNCASYISYDDVTYKIPDSEINKYIKEGIDIPVAISEKACAVDTFVLKKYENNISSLKITFSHYLLDDQFEILINIS